MDGAYRPERDVKLLSWSSVVVSPSEAKFSASGIHVISSEVTRSDDVRICEKVYASVVLSMEIMVGAPRRELLHHRRHTLPSSGSIFPARRVDTLLLAGGGERTQHQFGAALLFDVLAACAATAGCVDTV